MPEQIKLTEDDIRVHQTDIPIKNTEIILTIFSNGEQGLQLRQQILDNQKKIERITKLVKDSRSTLFYFDIDELEEILDDNPIVFKLFENDEDLV